jgi:hypothetical protein
MRRSTGGFLLRNHSCRCILGPLQSFRRRTLRLSLAVNGLQRLEDRNLHEPDFVFVVGDERYSCPSFVAEFLSPRVSSLRSQDVTIDAFPIETADPSHYFGSLLSIGFGHEVSFSLKELPFIRSVFGGLGNRRLFEKTLMSREGEIQEDELNARLAFFSRFDGTFDMDVGILAAHFYSLHLSDLDHLNLWVLQAILNDLRLVVRDED